MKTENMKREKKKRQGNAPSSGSDEDDEYGICGLSASKGFDCKVFKSLKTEDAFLIAFNFQF